MHKILGIALLLIANLACARGAPTCDASFFSRYIMLEGKEQFFQLECMGEGKMISSLNFGEEQIVEANSVGLYRFDLPEGATVRVTLGRRHLGPVYQWAAEVHIRIDGVAAYQDTLLGNVVFDLRRSDCYSAHGDWGFVPGLLELNYGKHFARWLEVWLEANQLRVSTRLAEEDWRWVRGNHLLTHPEACPEDQAMCQLWLEVPEGDELQYLSWLNGKADTLCVKWMISDG
ncbi:hypothetical protein [Aliagarivorans taiwanensis]|uniref:hypothetical protein n=1 Tax=Aliagarivorans taiwanensis TaxID=561966 RepID=UPI0004071011|nr:hypothetical protein [Aliagarivorans taiwanensis]